MDEIPQLDGHGRGLSLKQHDIVFENVSFSYENKEVLSNISFTIPDKTTTAIIGPSGSGKTTLCNMMLGCGQRQCQNRGV